MLPLGMNAKQNPRSDRPSAERSFDWLIAGVVVIGLAHFLSAMSPSVWTWGIDYWSLLPMWGRAVLLLLLAASIVPGVPERVAALVEHRALPHWGTWAAVAVAFALFLVLRSKGYSYGDGYSFRGYLSSGNLPTITGNLVLMCGDLVTHWLVYRSAILPLGGSVEMAYAVVSALAGVAALAAIAAIAQTVFPKDRWGRWAVIVSGFTSGMAVLWFGHVEAYSLVGAALLWSLAFLIAGRKAWAWGLWLLACAFHLLAVALLPVLILSSWGRSLFSGLSLRRSLLFFLTGFVGWGMAGSLVSLIEPGIFVPLLSTADSTYSAFSLEHLTDTANLLLFAAPLGALGLSAWLVRGPSVRSTGEISALTVMALASASLWYFSFWVDPLIGAFRDWDLIGAFGIPFSILGTVLLVRQNSANPVAHRQWVVLSVFALAHTGAFVMSARDEIRVMDRVDRLVREDVHYSRDFHKGERLMSWAFLLSEIPERKDAAIVHLTNRSRWEPRDLKSWSNLGSLYWLTGRYDSAAVSFEEALKLDASDPKTFEQLAFTYSGVKNWEKAAETVEKLSALRPLKEAELNLWAFCLLMKGDDRKAESLLTLSLTLEPNQQEAHYYRGIVYERRQDTINAVASYELALIPQTNVEDVYMRCSRLYQGLFRWPDAERVATAWMAQFPNSPSAPFTIGICRIAAKQYATARDALERAASLDSTSALTYFYLATAYRNLGETDRALATANRSAALDPSLALPYLELIYLAADREDRGAAVAATNEFLKRSPSDSGMSYLQQFMEP